MATIGIVVFAACTSSQSEPGELPPTPTAIPLLPAPTHIAEPPATANPTAAAIPTKVPSAVPPTPSATLLAPSHTPTPLPTVPIPVIVIEATASLGSCDFRLEIADDGTERSRGLMHRQSMPIDQGMLFVYDFEQELNFWMKNTLIPLDIAFFNDDLEVVDIQSMIPEHEILPALLPFYTSAALAKSALEINAGAAVDCGISTGDTMILTYLAG